MVSSIFYNKQNVMDPSLTLNSNHIPISSNPQSIINPFIRIFHGFFVDILDIFGLGSAFNYFFWFLIIFAILVFLVMITKIIRG